MRLTKIVAISSAFALVTALGMQGASALVWTDLADYSPGSVVTIHGDNSDGAAYVDGESVAVSVLGPNDYTAECTATVASGAWACDITLWDSLLAVGPYTYTATGQTSGVVETGAFTDGPGYGVTFAISATGVPVGEELVLTIGVTYTKKSTGASTNADLPVTDSNNSPMIRALTGYNITYSGFSASVTLPTAICTRTGLPSQPSTFAAGADNTEIVLTATYACTPLDRHSITFATTGVPNGSHFDVTGSYTTLAGGTGTISESLNGVDTSNALLVKPGTSITYAGFDSSFTHGGQTCTLSSISQASPFTAGANAESTTVTAAYSCVPTPVADTTGPVINVSVTAPDGNNGWNVGDVVVDWTITDPDSIWTITDGCVDETLTADVTSAVLSCTASSAGGSATLSTREIKIDKTAPEATLSVTAGTSGLNDWYTSDVTVHTSGTDATSGIASCTADQTQTTETAGNEFFGSCTDNAGNSDDASSLTIKLDKSGPSAELAVTAGTSGTNGWYTSDVTVGTSGTDSISSPVTCSVDQYQTTETTGATFNGSCTNAAGLTTNATALTVKLDKTGPTAALAVTAGTLGSNGWYTSDVTVGTSGTDSISSPVTCSVDQYQTTETTGATFNGSCTNDAGLTTNATALMVKLDKTGPVITPSSALPDSVGPIYYGDLPVSLTCSASDLISGVTGGACTVSGYETSTGTHTVTLSAINGAGITTTVTRTYTVNPWTLTGFYAPVDMRFVWNVVKAGSTVPLKFEVFKGATELTAKGQIVQGSNEGFTVTKNPTDAPPTVTGVPVPDSMLTSGKTQLRYDATSGQFIQNWQTPKSPGYYKVTLTTKDGSTLVAWFQLK